MEASTIWQLGNIQPAVRNRVAASLQSDEDGSFASLLAEKLYSASQAKVMNTTNTTTGASTSASDSLASILSGLINEGEGNNLSSCLLMMCMMMGQSGTGNSGIGVMMSSLMGAMSGNASYGDYINTVSAGKTNYGYGYVPASFLGSVNAGTDGNNAYVVNPTATGIPSSPSVACNPTITSNAYNRSAALYRNVIDQFNVENNSRYDKNNGSTYCNIFLWDVTRAMGAEIPHYIDPKTWDTRYYPDTKGALQMTANRTYDWLFKKGSEYGWHQVSAEQAQALANSGRPVVTAYKNPSGHGHVQVVCPSKDGTYNAKKGVTIAQAGSRLYNYAYISDVFSKKGMSKVVYFAHN